MNSEPSIGNTVSTGDSLTTNEPQIEWIVCRFIFHKACIARTIEGSNAFVVNRQSIGS